MTAPDPTARIVCYTRLASLVAPVDETLRTLDRLEDDDVIDNVTIDAWPSEVRLEADGPPRSHVVDRFEAFEAWADRRNVTIRPPFAVETRRSEITGETRHVLVTPVQCLALYVDSTLLAVFPHTTDREGDGETYTVRDALSVLEARGDQLFAYDQPPPPFARHRARVDEPERTVDPNEHKPV